MAAVISTPEKDQVTPLTVSLKNQDSLPRYKTPLWTSAEGIDAQNAMQIRALDAQVDWTTDFLEAAQNGTKMLLHRKQSVIGIRSPKPVGIITYEDLIDMLLQKTSRDEKDFFDRGAITPPTKSKKAGDHASISSVQSVVKSRPSVPAYVQKAQSAFQRPNNDGTLRRRNISHGEKAINGMDGADERDICTFDGADDRSIIVHKLRENGRSSYTQNSGGGFHGADETGASIENAMVLSPTELAELSTNPELPPHQDLESPVLKTVSLPSRKGMASTFPEGLTPLWRRVSAAAAPRLPQLRRVTPFSRQNYSSYERMVEEDQEKSELILPIASLFSQQVDFNASSIDISQTLEPSVLEDHCRQDSGDTISLDSWNYGDFEAFYTLRSEVYGGSPVKRPEVRDKENTVPTYVSKTLPRMKGLTADLGVLSERRNSETPLREKSFHDDRALLPSQRRVPNGSAQFGGRSTSLWF
jgi:metal transporter CNNM